MSATEDRPVTYDADAPIACSLTPREMDGRVRLLADIRAALTALERSPRGLVLHLAATEETLADVQRFVAAEMECCPFWGLAVTTVGAETILRWEGPAEASPILDELHRYLAGDETVDPFAGLL